MIVTESLARDFFRLIVWYPVRWFLTALPVRQSYSVLRWMGHIHFLLPFNSKKAILKKNLRTGLSRLCLSEERLTEIVRNYYQNHYVNQLQIFIFPKLHIGNINNIHKFEGLEHLNKSLEQGKGCILLHCHFGPTQMPLHMLGILGYQAVQIGLPSDKELSFIGRHVAFRLRMKYEGKIRAKIIPATAFLRAVFETLRGNGIILMTGDGAGGNTFIGKSCVEEFLDKKNRFTLGALRLSEKTGAVVLPMFTVIENSSYKTIIHPPLQVSNYAQMHDFAKLMESYVVRFPYLWHFWDEYHKRCIHKGSA